MPGLSDGNTYKPLPWLPASQAVQKLAFIKCVQAVAQEFADVAVTLSVIISAYLQAWHANVKNKFHYGIVQAMPSDRRQAVGSYAALLLTGIAEEFNDCRC